MPTRADKRAHHHFQAARKAVTLPTYDSEAVPERSIASELSVYPGGGKWLESAPDGLAIGAIRLRGWDLHAIKPLPAEYSDHDVYQVKLVYDLELDPHAPRPAWIEVGFSFRSGESTGPAATSTAMVLDALPRTVLDPEKPQGYRLNQSLMFVPHDNPSSCSVFLDDIAPTVDVFGIGGPEIRWRHLATRKEPLRLGSRTAWITLSVPAGTDELTVEVQGKFELRGKTDRPQTGAEPVRFQLPLQPGAITEPALTEQRTQRGPNGPTVFICYTQDDLEHCILVRQFANFLIEQGCGVEFDAFVPPERQNWDTWSTGVITRSDFTTVVASPRMRAVGDNEVKFDENRGSQSELAKIGNLLQKDRHTWTRRILPVILPGYDVEDIPLMFHGYTENHYRITSFTPEGARFFLDTLFYRFGGHRPVVRPIAT